MSAGRSEEKGEEKRIFKDFYFFFSELLGRRQPPPPPLTVMGLEPVTFCWLFSGVRGDTPGYGQVRRFQRGRRRLSGGKDSCGSGSQHNMHSRGEEKRKEK